MTPEPMPTRLRREAARWGGSKLAELLTQAAEEMEAVAREARKLICSYCGLVQTAETVEGKVTLAVEHMLVCDKRPELELIEKLEAAAREGAEMKARWEHAESRAKHHAEYADHAEAQLAACRKLLDTVRDYLTREAHPDWTDAGRVSMAQAAITGPSPGDA